MYSVRFLLGAAFGLSLGLRNETNGLKGLLYGINVIVFGTSWYDNLHNVQCMSIINSYILYFLISSQVPMIWLKNYLEADTNSYNQSLNSIGVYNALALCFLVWITVFTMKHEEEEISLGKFISDAAISAVKEVVQESTESIQDDTEF